MLPIDRDDSLGSPSGMDSNQLSTCWVNIDILLPCDCHAAWNALLREQFGSLGASYKLVAESTPRGWGCLLLPRQDATALAPRINGTLHG